MPETILVLLRHSEEANSLLGAAARLAEIMGGARVNAVAVCETIQIAPSPAATLVGRSEALLDAREEERERVLVLRGLCDGWNASTGRRAAEVHWFEAEGGTEDIVAQWGRRADVIVTGRPSPGDWLGHQAFKAALLGTGRPILMVPPGPATSETGAAFGRCIAIAWRDDKQALRAVLPALRWLAGAEEVHVLVGVSDTAHALGVPSVLLEHGLRASLHVLALRPGPLGQRLLDLAHNLSADLLVMGAYAHSPLRELVFGGVTRHMLACADLPVLMRH
ncbi:universal stress protein [Acidiphilium sp. AL]|uniref:Universal stress protein n=1 Tax=Acidiphilium iwatense TaxID=768198 RepID=A0ABS9DR34_9PROT|nr:MULTISPECIES: universal stress protein [Acidiphilium]MCF3945216.1 universal stress protein [Acidiphilium iwatense]MCU4159492.1 universal stress protein [Acidiphilium sp. AL]